MEPDEEAFATITDWINRVEKAEASVREARQRNEGLQASVAELTATNRRLNQDVEELTRRLKREESMAIRLQLLLEKTAKQRDELMALSTGPTVAETPQEPDLVPGLPEQFMEVAMEALERFRAGYDEYGPGAADTLGLAGQWGDLHRKVMKLKRAMWSGEVGYLTRENEYDILHDIIGHCILAIDMMNRGLEPGR